jgi:DNA polymerase III alpha subunit (gram-positive type)
MEEVLIDLHTHTKCSDGMYSPIDLYNLIKQISGNQKVVWSVTDHDCVDAYFELNKINDNNVKLVLVTYAVKNVISNPIPNHLKTFVKILLFINIPPLITATYSEVLFYCNPISFIIQLCC